MSKRISNKKGEHAGARCKGARISYWRRQELDMLAERRISALKALAKAKKKKDREELAKAIRGFGAQIRNLVPKVLLRRHQSRSRHE